MHVTVVQQSRKLAQHGLEHRRFDGGAVMCEQGSQTGQSAHLQGPLVLPQEGPQLGQKLRQDGGQVDLEEVETEKVRGGGEFFFFGVRRKPLMETQR